MKTYDFPYSDILNYWHDSVTVEMTDEQAGRLEAQMEINKKARTVEEFTHFQECEYLEDIRRFVWKAVIEDIARKNDPEYLRRFGDEGCSLEVCANALITAEGISPFWPGTDLS